MKQLKISNIVEVIVISFFVFLLSMYIVIGFITCPYGLTLAPIETGNMPLIFVGIIGGLLGWSIDRLVNRIKLVLGEANEKKKI